jgi:drug/metabolite transporter (DMT)-like permease
VPAKNKVFPYIAVIIAAITWGFSFLFTKNTLAYLDTFQLLGYRFIVAALGLSVLVVLRIIKINLTLVKLKGLLVVALLQPVLYFICETIGVKLTSASESGIIIALVPIAITLCSVFLFKERLSLSKWFSVAVCVAGVIVIVLSNGIVAGSGQLAGVAALLGAVVAAGFYNPVSRKASQQSSPMEITFVMMWVGAIVFTTIGILSTKGGIGTYFSLFGNTTVLVNIAYLGIVSSVVAFFCLNYALSKLESTVIGTFINLTPVVSVFAGVAIGGEKLVPLQFVGAALILAGIWGTARMKSEPASAPLPVPPE